MARSVTWLAPPGGSARCGLLARARDGRPHARLLADLTSRDATTLLAPPRLDLNPPPPHARAANHTSCGHTHVRPATPPTSVRQTTRPVATRTCVPHPPRLCARPHI